MKKTVAYAKIDSYDDRTLLREAIKKVLSPQLAAFGSLRGKKVMIKPNLLVWKGKGEIASVNPAVIAETAAIFKEEGAAVVDIREIPAVQTAYSIIKAMGIDPELEKLGINVGGFEKYLPIQSQNEKEKIVFHNLELASEFQDYDAVVDLAKAKTHGMMTFTFCVKNLFGLIRGSERLSWHLAVGKDFLLFADMLLDLYLAVKPHFNILDGIVCMEGNGPGSGTPAPRGFIAGSNDALALDDSVCGLFGVKKIPLLIQAEKRGLIPEYEELDKEKVACSPLLLPDPPGLLCEWGVFLPPFLKTLLRDSLISRPVLDKGMCVGCGLCAKMCPPRSLKLVKGKPVFDLKSCIRCYCCQEHCPKSAITPRRSLFMKIGTLVEKLLEKIFGKGKKNTP